MDNKEIARELKSLCKIDIDAFFAYTETFRHIDAPDAKKNVERFRDDHERHIKDLSDEIRSLGEEPPKFSRDFKGYVLDVFTKVRSLTGTEGSMKALRSGEETTNKKYGEAVKLGFPDRILTLINRNFKDEQGHLSYIEQAIKNQVWKKAA